MNINKTKDLLHIKIKMNITNTNDLCYIKIKMNINKKKIYSI